MFIRSCKLKGLANEAKQIARDRVQCTKSYTRYMGVLSFSNLNNFSVCGRVLFQVFKAILDIWSQRL